MERPDHTLFGGGIDLIATGIGWLAVNKPWGMSVHNAPGRDLCSQMDRRLQRDPALGQRLRRDPDFGVHPVHRLDRETSGVILLACRRDTLGALAGQFQAGGVTKRYHAMVHGGLAPAESKEGWGLWQRPLSRNAGGRSNPAGTPPRKPCRTRYRIVARSDHYTLLACEPVTGRKHQIRRHAKLAGHPVVGDKRYGSRRSCDFLSKKRDFHRLGLHAAAITFSPPEKGQPVTVAAETLPGEMTRLLEDDLAHTRREDGSDPR
jgi:RluA family pseudouridine synthase